MFAITLIVNYRIEFKEYRHSCVIQILRYFHLKYLSSYFSNNLFEFKN